MAHGVAARERLVDPRPYGTADTALGLDLLGAYCRSDPGANVVLSPSSLASGLGMAYLGARGGTARAMAGVLHLPAAGDQAIATGTRGRIPHLLRPGSLDDHIGWVLTDALYLHAAWAAPFDPDETSPGPFTTAARSARR